MVMGFRATTVGGLNIFVTLENIFWKYLFRCGFVPRL